MELQVFIFTWNTQTVRYNIDDGPHADFVNILGDKIINSNYDLVVIGLQEDSIRDSLLLSDRDSLIVDSISTKYQLIKLASLSGWGVTTYKALKNEWDYRPRGLRLAIFKRKDLKLEITGVDTAEMVCPSFKDWVTSGKGCVVVNLHTSLGSFAFLNIHLPFSSRSIIQNPEHKVNRHSAVMWQAHCLRKLYEDILKMYQPDYLFLFGDLNFRVQIRTETGAKEIAQKIFEDPDYIKELIREADELQLLFDYAKYASDSVSGEEKLNRLIPILSEGVNNSGPVFLPTCKLKQGRKKITMNSYKLGRQNHRTPSWCDRILFKQFQSNGEICCILYDYWEYGTMTLSDHAAVIGVYRITTQCG
uniref:Inositol polyphosphate-related phosphatase domain-containing protein n=1 Tax=Marseillevirus LCMAC201 TaxID=2506605 RepID=A0A481YVW2_9VIRU|nr:MAG: uncharacterized protein LCMAC201_01410 [Marseillevirus LCMAC201]